MIKYKIIGLKLSKLLTGISQKKFSAIIEEPEKAPEWLTTGITFLIPNQETARKSETTDLLHA